MGHVHALVVLHEGAPQGHAVAQGHALGGVVVVPDDGEELREVQGMETVLPAGGGRLDGEALAPPVPAEVVADLRDLPAGRNEMILETNRLILRPLTEEDFDAWTAVLGDPEVMYAYEHGFSPEEVRQWIERQQERYAKDGFGLWALIEKTSGQLIGDCGVA